jgi:hypothetical protein
VNRLVAALVAVGLIAVALVVRHGIDSGGGGGSNASGKLRLVCTPELEAVCNKLGSDVDVTIQDPGSTQNTLEKATSSPDFDGWLTPGPWAQIVEAARKSQGAQPLLASGSALGRTRVGLAVWPDRLAVLVASCPNRQISWKCLGEAAGKGTWTALGGPSAWGPIAVGFPDPPNDATGLSALGAASVGYFGKTDLSSADLDDPGFRSWLRNLAQANADHPTLNDVLARGPAEAAAVATLDAVGGPVLASSPRSPKPTLTYPAPVASADVVLGSLISDRGRQLAQLVDERMPELLRKAGWAVSGGPTGLPAPDLLDALRDAWNGAK